MTTLPHPGDPTTPAPGALPSQTGEPTWEIAAYFPRQGDWGEDEYLELDRSGRRMIELVHGRLEFPPMPNLPHQLIVDFLHTALKSFVRKHADGYVLFAPLPVHLGPKHYREPDIVYLRRERVTDLHDQPEGADLVMEVVSEGAESRERDLEAKRREYAAAGIAEYWIVDPQERKVTVLALEDGGSYREHGIFGAGENADSPSLPGFGVPVSEIFAAGEGEAPVDSRG